MCLFVLTPPYLAPLRIPVRQWRTTQWLVDKGRPGQVQGETPVPRGPVRGFRGWANRKKRKQIFQSHSCANLQFALGHKAVISGLEEKIWKLNFARYCTSICPRTQLIFFNPFQYTFVILENNKMDQKHYFAFSRSLNFLFMYSC